MTPKQFKQKRKDLDITQRELAKDLGLAKNGNVTIRRIENGKANSSDLLQTCFKYYILLKENNLI